MKWGMVTRADLELLINLNRIGFYIFCGFSLLSFLRFIFSKYIHIIKCFTDKKHNFKFYLTHITKYKKEIITVLCIVFTLIIFLNSKTSGIKPNLLNTITIFILLTRRAEYHGFTRG